MNRLRALLRFWPWLAGLAVLAALGGAGYRWISVRAERKAQAERMQAEKAATQTREVIRALRAATEALTRQADEARRSAAVHHAEAAEAGRRADAALRWARTLSLPPGAPQPPPGAPPPRPSEVFPAGVVLAAGQPAPFAGTLFRDEQVEVFRLIGQAAEERGNQVVRQAAEIADLHRALDSTTEALANETERGDRATVLADDRGVRLHEAELSLARKEGGYRSLRRTAIGVSIVLALGRIATL